jgi:hypothetical protein
MRVIDKSHTEGSVPVTAVPVEVVLIAVPPGVAETVKVLVVIDDPTT